MTHDVHVEDLTLPDSRSSPISGVKMDAFQRKNRASHIPSVWESGRRGNPRTSRYGEVGGDEVVHMKDVSAIA